MNAELGAGREKKDPIDPAAGIILERKTGDMSRRRCYCNASTGDESRLDEGERIFPRGWSLANVPELELLFFARLQGRRRALAQRR